MTTHVGIAHVTISLDASDSLKDKRRTIKSLISRTSNKFNVAVAESGNLDDRHSALLAIACLSNDHSQTDRMLAEIIHFVEVTLSDGYVTHVETEITAY